MSIYKGGRCMARPKRWRELEIINGVYSVELSNWKYFNDYITKEWLDFPNYVWRGQRKASWKLEPTLDRILREQGKPNNLRVRAKHLEKFKYAARGRRGSNPPSLEEDDWWALGQHNFLATPLLDWTASPYVAAYFAFSESNNEDEKVSIFALDEARIDDKEKQLIKEAFL